MFPILSLVISNKKLKEVNDILNKQIQNLEEEKYSSEARYLSILDKLAGVKEEFSLCKLELQLAKEQKKNKLRQFKWNMQKVFLNLIVRRWS